MKQRSLNIPFVKMQATGNDFILIDNRDGLLADQSLSALAPVICDRKYGVGSDGLIALEEDGDGHLVMLYKNPDGSDAGMCGNGGRCFTLFARSLGYSDQVRFTVHGKRYEAVVDGSGSGEAANDTPDDGPASNGRFLVKLRFPLETRVEQLSVDGQPLLNIYTNTEHVVCSVDSEQINNDDELVAGGRRLRHHEQFAPKGTNVNFITDNGTDNLSLRTYERGVEGLTLACGTGAVAAAIGRHHLQSAGAGSFTYIVQTRGGPLTVRFNCSGTPALYKDISLEGPAAPVFEGVYFTDEI